MICDNTIYILNIINNKLSYISHLSLESKILKIIKDSDDELIIHLQS